jgi:hypothetical protein
VRSCCGHRLAICPVLLQCIGSARHM